MLVRAATILLDHGRRDDAGRLVAAIRRLAPDAPGLEALVGRLGAY